MAKQLNPLIVAPLLKNSLNFENYRLLINLQMQKPAISYLLQKLHMLSLHCIMSNKTKPSE